MPYHLSYREFEEYLATAFPQSALANLSSEETQGESRARFWAWRRFDRCWGAPVPAHALFPRARSCDPAVFNDPAHWDQVYRKVVRLRTIDARRRHPVWVEGLTRPSDLDGEMGDPFEGERDPRAHTESTALTDVELDDLEHAVRYDFDVNVPFGPQIRTATLNSIDALREGATNSLAELINDELLNDLPTQMGLDATGRQRRSRAAARGLRFVREWAARRG